MNPVYMFSDDAEIQLMLDKAYKNEVALRFNDSQIQATELIGNILNQRPCVNLDDACLILKNRIIDLNKKGAFAHPSKISQTWKIWTVAPKGSFIFYYTMQTAMFNCEERLIDSKRVDLEDFFKLLFGTVEKIPLPPSYRDYDNSVVNESNAVKQMLRGDLQWIEMLKDIVRIIKSDKNHNRTHYAMFTLLEKHIKEYSQQLKSQREKLDAILNEYACVACHEKPHDVVFPSCRMCCVCQSCFARMIKEARKNNQPVKCPMCRVQVENPILLTKWNRVEHGPVIFSKSSINDVYSLLASLKTHA